MNIAIDTRLLGYGAHTGIQEYAENIIKNIVSCEPQNQFQFFHNGARIAPLPKSWAERPNIKIINWRIPNKILDAAFGIFNAPIFQTKPDIIFSPHFNLIPQGEAPRVITFHDLSFLHHPDFFPWRKRWWHFTQRYKAQAKRAAHIIAVSEFTKNDLINLLGLPPEKISVIYSGLHPQFKPLLKNDAGLLEFKKRCRLNFPFILHLGTLQPRKNIPALIRAFNILKSRKFFADFRLVLAGAPGWLYGDIIKEAKTSPFSEHIIFFGPVKPSERVLLYNLSRVFVYPSFFEGFGLPPLEAQASGVPVIAAERTSLEEVLGNSAELFNPWKAGELAHIIGQILMNETLHKDLSQKGLENIKRFSWERSAKETLDIFKKISAHA